MQLDPTKHNLLAALGLLTKAGYTCLDTWAKARRKSYVVLDIPAGVYEASGLFVTAPRQYYLWGYSNLDDARAHVAHVRSVDPAQLPRFIGVFPRLDGPAIRHGLPLVEFCSGAQQL